MDDRERVLIEYGFLYTPPITVALSKQIPAELVPDEEYIKCPRCGLVYFDKPEGLNFIKHCYECGQALKWEKR